MKLTGKLLEVSFGVGGKPRLTIEINERNALLTGFDELHGQEVAVDVKRYFPRRSLDANAFYWLLCGKLAEKINVGMKEIYRNHIRNIGGNYEVYCGKTEAVEKLTKAWEKNGLGWIAETTPSKLDGCTNAILYYGSSTYDSRQMSRLIDQMVQDCKEQGIQTETPAEIARMCEEWGNDNHKTKTK